jgi:cytochrome c-type biogenesis protein
MTGADAGRPADAEGAEGAQPPLVGAQVTTAQAAGSLPLTAQPSGTGTQPSGAGTQPSGGSVGTAAGPARPGRGRVVAGTALFVLGFSALYTSYGLAFGGLGSVLRTHQQVLTQVLGALTIVLGLLFAGALDRFMFAGRIVRPSLRPRAGLAGAPLLGVLFGLGWSPCIGPTLTAVLTLAETSGTADRGAFLAFVYCLGLGTPFLIVALAFQRGMRAFGFARRHARLVTFIGGGMLVVVGLLEVTGLWGTAVTWMQLHWFGAYNAPI